MRIVINGTGVAGPALAFWLTRSGHEVVLVESAPALRTGGYVIDFWGIGYDIAERMGVIDEIRALGYRSGRYVLSTATEGSRAASAPAYSRA